MLPHDADAQYYSWGNSPASIRWDNVRTEYNRFIFPDTFSWNARRAQFYFDAVRPSISYGFRFGTMFSPVILHTQNLSSNGIVMWAPKRIELIAVPPAETYSEPWLKQLAAHEYRHNVQYNNVNRGFVRVLNWIFGQQGAFVGLALLPLWFIEGDAVMMETEMSSFGRALQPSFSMGYRAIGDVGSRRYAADKWFCGSFKDYVPDHYALGYQMVQWCWNHYDTFIWDRVTRYAAEHPYFIVPHSIALKRFYNTSTLEIFRNTFRDLNNFWDNLPPVRNTTEILPTPITSYTTYSHPQFLNDSTIIAFKNDYDRPYRIVSVDARTGAERRIAYIGSFNTRPALSGNRLYWTEYRQSTTWSERVNSTLCWIDLTEKRARPHTVRSEAQILYPTPMDKEGLAYVEYDYTGRYRIVEGLTAQQGSLTMPDTVEVHGLAWDDKTRSLYFIGLSDGGMWLGTADPSAGTFRLLTPPRHITISSLRASGGLLYFGSIVSGKDEAHAYDLKTGTEYRLSESHYGSFSPASDSSGRQIVLTTYNQKGYLLATQSGENRVVQESRTLPIDRVNPPRKPWPVINIDTVRFTPSDYAACEQKTPPKRYRTGLNLFSFHSWAPFEFNPSTIIPELDFSLNAGVTVMSQNLLSSMTTYASYGWNRKTGSQVTLGIDYSGLGPHINLQTHYGGGRQIVYSPGTVTETPKLKRFYDLSLQIYQPINLSSGYRLRYLTPSVDYYYTNGLRYANGSFHRGVHRLAGSIQYAEQARMAYRDFLPRWGYAFKASIAGNPFNKGFRPIYSLYARGYLPGVAQHHSLTLRTGYQQVFGRGTYAYRIKEVFPRGADYNFSSQRYAAVSADYQFPLCYPDGGIPSILYFKRIRLNLWFDYSRYQDFRSSWHTLTSWGGGLLFDINLFRMPAASNASVEVSIAKPSDRKGVVALFSIDLPI